MPADESQGLSSQDLQDLHQIMGMLAEGDPRRGKIGALLSQQLQQQATPPQPPQPTMTTNAATGEGPLAAGMTSFETQLSKMPGGMWDLLKQSWNDPKFEPVGTIAKGLNPVQRTDAGLPNQGANNAPIDWGATAANVVPWFTDLGGRGIGKSPALSIVTGAASEHLPSIQRAQAAFNHLDAGLGDLTPASEPRFAPQVERIGQVAQQVADRFEATKLKSVPPIVKQLLDRVADTSKPVSWTDLRQFKTDLNTLVWDREIPSQFKGPLKNLVKTVDQGLRAGADLRGQGEVFSRANTDFRRSMSLERGAEAAGPYIGAVAGAATGAGLGEAVGHPWPGYWAGKVAGWKAGGPLAGRIARSITERNVGPQSFPDIPASKVSAAQPAAAAAKPTVNVGDVSSAMENLGYKKADALRMARDAVNRNPNDFNAAIKSALNPGPGTAPAAEDFVSRIARQESEKGIAQQPEKPEGMDPIALRAWQESNKWWQPQEDVGKVSRERRAETKSEKLESAKKESYLFNDPKYIKGRAMREAAAERQRTGNLTGKEQAAKQAKLAGNYIGKEVIVGDQGGKVTGTAFGKIKIQLEDGSNITAYPEDIKPK